MNRDLPSVKKCNGKVMYDKKGAITAKNARFKESHVLLRAYYHDECDSWHLTHKGPYADSNHYRFKKK